MSRKIKHAQHGRLTGLTEVQLAIMQAALRNEVVLKTDAAALCILKSRELGASEALLALACDIGLDKLIAPGEPQAQWVRDGLAMAVGRIVWQGSKLALARAGVRNLGFVRGGARWAGSC